jgi:carbonic anhydrase/acetyltransferase-like protein (isoleucine patch superfamily)
VIEKNVVTDFSAKEWAPVMDNTFVGMQSLVFKSFVGKGCVLEPGVILMGVSVPDGRYVPAGSVIRTQG